MIKRTLLSILAFFFVTTSFAQLLNEDFESWKIDTSIFGFPPALQFDTFDYLNPIHWSSSNQFSLHKDLGAAHLVTQSTTSNTGIYAVQIETGQITDFTTFPPSQVTLPGVFSNGKLRFNAADVIVGNDFDPYSVPGTGHPWTTRAQTFSGWINYTAVGTDTAELQAVLVSDRETVAIANFQQVGSTSGYVQFSADFEYLNCLVPDTVVIVALSSAIPEQLNNPGGNVGSTLLLDDVSVSGSIDVPPFAVNDTVLGLISEDMVTIQVQNNDEDCEGTMTTTITSPPSMGSANVVGTDIEYTGAVGMSGTDILSYEVCDGMNQCTEADVFITMDAWATSISNSNNSNVSLYPNPANDRIVLKGLDGEFNKIEIYDLLGNNVYEQLITQESEKINLDFLPQGNYFVKITDYNSSALVIKHFNKF